jgi:hypothetical protein
MPRQLINRSWDLQKLQNEGYELEIKSGFLLVKSVPYVNSRKEVHRGILVAKLVLAGDKTARPDDHVAYFAGEHPCNADGTEIAGIKHTSGERTLAEGVVIQHSFSAKPKPLDYYRDYHAKMATYAALLAGPAQLIDPSAKPQTFKVVEPEPDKRETPFNYIDTASSRAEMASASASMIGAEPGAALCTLVLIWAAAESSWSAMASVAIERCIASCATASVISIRSRTAGDAF